ncbi:large ribosomal subunit protein uL13m-like isoform X1 [Dysidea avara]|uniref:large ribosomal subunit protein uL13m-like isoform X1 n=1 Tax=Dysidea avara TaxID=196820 RepID=UPI00332C27F0
MASPLSNSIHTFTRLWYKIDCRGQVVGRLAIQASQLLQGKTKPIYHPAVDVGDHVILTNTRHVAFTGNKWKDKLYRHHTGYPGGLHTMTAEKLHDKDPTLVIKKAIYGMLPKNRQRQRRMKRLYLFPDDMDKDHPYNQNVTHEILGVTIVPRALEEYTQEEINNYPKLIEWNE